MFFHLLTAKGSHDQIPAVFRADIVTTWAQIADAASRLAKELYELRRGRIGVSIYPNATSFAVLAALDELQCDVFLIDGQFDSQTRERLAGELELSHIVHCPNPDLEQPAEVFEFSSARRGDETSSVTILTSGTTGKPKAARHTWESLARPARVGKPDIVQRWLLTYRPNLYAGLQVILQTFVNHGTLVAPDASDAPEDVAQLMANAGVEYASATPSYWRRMAMFAQPETLRQSKIRQITLGGEVIDQQILDALTDIYPDARIAHVYATTELGRCFSVIDGRSGFPADYLEHPTKDGVELTVENGELLVRSANAMQQYDKLSAKPAAEFVPGQWYHTGDMVEAEGDRIYFVGRRSDMINVGGNKVNPIEVERFLRSIDGVQDVRVYGKKSSILGQLVACEIVPSPEADAVEFERMINERAEAQLPPHQRPHIIILVGHIQLNASGKTGRGTQ